MLRHNDLSRFLPIESKFNMIELIASTIILMWNVLEQILLIR